MQKNIWAIVLTLLSSLVAPPIIDEVTDDTPAPQVSLDAPDKCVVGELVRLTYPARKVEWKLPGTDFEVLANDQKALVTFRQPGTYQVIVSGLVDSDVRLVSHDIVCEGPVVAPTPSPDNHGKSVLIDDKDVPEPSPEPLVPTYGITSKVVDWCTEADVDVETAAALAENFTAAASTTSEVPDLMRTLADKNRKIEQGNAQGVLVKIQVWLIENLTGEGFVEHQCAISEIGDGFRQYAEKN